MAHLESEELRAVTASANTATATGSSVPFGGISDLSEFWQNVSGQLALTANASQSELAGFWSNESLSGLGADFPECICSDLQHDDYSPLYAWFNYIIIIIMLPSLSVFGVLTNIVNVFIFSRKRMETSANTYLFFLACSDFMVILTGLFIFWIDSARSYITVLVQAPYTTVYTLPFGYMAQTCSIYFTVAAAFDCYISVCWNRASRGYCTPRRARQINGCIVFCSILYNSLRFPQFNLRRCFHDGSQELVIEICPTTLFFTINTVYNVYLYMILMTLLPFCLLLILNLLIIIKKSIDNRRQSQKLSAERKRLKMSAAQSPCSPDASTAVNGDSTKSCKFDYSGENGSIAHSTPPTIHKKAEYDVGQRSSLTVSIVGVASRVGAHPQKRSASCISTNSRNTTADDTITMIMVVILFLCCNTLALIVNVIETFFEPDALLLNLLSDTSNFLVVFNSSVNCVIYMIFNTEYREHFLMYLLKLKQHHTFLLFFGNAKAKEERRLRLGNYSKQQQQQLKPQQQIARHTNAEKFLYRSYIPIQQHTDNGHSHTNSHKNSERDISTHTDTTVQGLEEDFNYGYTCCHSPIWYQHSRIQRPSWSSTVVENSILCECEKRISKSETKLSFQPSNSDTLMLMDDDSGLDESASTMAASSTTALLSNLQEVDRSSLPYHHATSYLAEVKIMHEQIHLSANGVYGNEMRPHIYVRPLTHEHSHNNNNGSNNSNSNNSNSTYSHNNSGSNSNNRNVERNISALTSNSLVSKLSITAL